MIGLEIQDHRLRITQQEWTRRGISKISSTQIDLEEGVIHQGQIQDPFIVASMIKEKIPILQGKQLGVAINTPHFKRIVYHTGSEESRHAFFEEQIQRSHRFIDTPFEWEAIPTHTDQTRGRYLLTAMSKASKQSVQKLTQLLATETSSLSLAPISELMGLQYLRHDPFAALIITDQKMIIALWDDSGLAFIIEFPLSEDFNAQTSEFKQTLAQLKLTLYTYLDQAPGASLPSQWLISARQNPHALSFYEQFQETQHEWHCEWLQKDSIQSVLDPKSKFKPSINRTWLTHIGLGIQVQGLTQTRPSPRPSLAQILKTLLKKTKLVNQV
ncbi:MAG: hypothetical protein CL521_03280 [Actinobacteria bacterium]|nr:hypothetical protein [Actinomycetota bacterium]